MLTLREQLAHTHAQPAHAAGCRQGRCGAAACRLLARGGFECCAFGLYMTPASRCASRRMTATEVGGTAPISEMTTDTMSAGRGAWWWWGKVP